MKKLVLFLAVAFSVSLFSCGGSDKKAEATDSTDVVAVEVAPCDSCNADSCNTPCEEAPAQAE